MGSVEYDTREYYSQMEHSGRSMNEDEDYLYDRYKEREAERYHFDRTRCTEPMVRMVHEAAMCVAMMNQIRWGKQTHSVIQEAA